MEKEFQRWMICRQSKKLPQYQYIDSIVLPVVEAAKRDSIQFFERKLSQINEIEQSEMNGISIIKYCLEFYTSQDLDSIATFKSKELEHLWK